MSLTSNRPGYRMLMNEIKRDDIKADPWGTSVSWLFAIATVSYVRFGTTLPEFSPGPLLSADGYSPDDSVTETVLDYVDNGEVTEHELTEVYAILTRFDAWCRAAGRNY